jgi:hypothetical protein
LLAKALTESRSRELPGLGVVTTLHATPFQCSARFASATPSFETDPTAQTSVDETAATPLKRLIGNGGAGGETLAHEDPPQCSMSIWLENVGLNVAFVSPTAQTSLAETAAVPVSTFARVPFGLAIAWYLPSHVSVLGGEGATVGALCARARTGR